MGGMLKLSNAISGWRPTAPAREPIVLIEAAWEDIVGAQVAQHSHPIRIAGETLFIVTGSSAWSNQLSLLAEQVVKAVCARLPDAGVTQLRFRVGKVPARHVEPAARRRDAHAGARAERPAAASAAEALERFRQEVERGNHAKRSEGWKPCLRCGALVEPRREGLCASCAVAGDRERAQAAARLLFEAPWLGYAGTAALVSGLKEEDYERIRVQLLTRWWATLVRACAAKRLSKDGRERLVASSYVLLRSRIPPEEILPATVRSILGEEIHDLIYREQQKA